MPPQDSGVYLLHIPSGYALTECTHDDSTISNISGPGRIVGSLLAYAGSRLENFVDRLVERRLGRGPNVAVLRLIAELHQVHVYASKTINASPCHSEFVKSALNANEITQKLIWVCNGLCSQCKSPYLPCRLEDLPDSVHKLLAQLNGFLGSDSFSNSELAITYFHLLILSEVIAPSQLQRINLTSSLRSSLDKYQRTNWLIDPPLPVVFILRDMLNRIAPPHHGQASQSAGRLRFQNLAAGVNVQGESRFSLIDMQIEAVEDQEIFSTRIIEHIRVTQMCTHIRHLAHNRADQLSLEFSNKDLLRLQMQLNVSDFPPIILDHITSAYQELGSTLLQSHLRILKGYHRDFNLSLAFSPDSQLLASTSSKCSVQIWDTCIEGQQPRTINRVKSALISSLAFAPDGQHIAAALGDMTVRLWEVSTKEQTAILHGHSDRTRCVTFSPDGKFLVSGSYDKTIRLWYRHTGFQFSVLKGHTDWINDVSVSPDGALIASGSDDKTVGLWSVYTKRQWFMLSGHERWVSSVAFSPDSTRLASGSGDMTIRLWDVKLGHTIAVLQGHSDTVRTVAFSPDGIHVASGSYDRTVRLWDLQDSRRSFVLEGHQDWVMCVVFSPDGTRMASSAEDLNNGDIFLWDVRIIAANPAQ